MGRKKKTTQQFIYQANLIHKNKYDYSKTLYVDSQTKVCITCPEHGEFYQNPNNHINGCGCPKCKSINTSNVLKSNTIEFINKANKIHKNKYNYEKVNYINNKTKVLIICPIHGQFEQTPLIHLRGSGCPKCKLQERSNKMLCTLEDFIIKANIVHNNKYDYSKVNYTGKRNKIIIICPIHGEFIQEAGHHLQGCGCPKCNTSKGEKFIQNFLIQENIKFEYQYSINVSFDINPSGIAKIDFYLPDYNCFIEYNGKQHYESIEHFGGIDGFKRQQARDEFVKTYCELNKIKFIEIKYDISNAQIVEILSSLLTFKKQ